MWPLEADTPAAKSSLFKVIYSSYKRCRWQQLLLTFCYEALYFSLDQIKQHPILSAVSEGHLNLLLV